MTCSRESSGDGMPTPYPSHCSVGHQPCTILSTCLHLHVHIANRWLLGQRRANRNFFPKKLKRDFLLLLQPQISILLLLFLLFQTSNFNFNFTTTSNFNNYYYYYYYRSIREFDCGELDSAEWRRSVVCAAKGGLRGEFEL